MNPDWLQPHLERIRAELDTLGRATTCIQQEFAAIHTRLQGVLRAFVRPRVADAARVEDLVQQTLKSCWEELATFRGDNFLGWLFRIAERHCMDQHRNRRVAPLPPHEVAERNGSTDQLDQLATTERAQVEWQIAERFPGLLQDLELLQRLEPAPDRKVGGQSKEARPRALLRDIELKIREYLNYQAAPLREQS